MPSTEDPFYVWLAAQPAFIEVALGILFVVVLAPAVLAAAAGVLGHLEQFIETAHGLMHPASRAARRIDIRPTIASLPRQALPGHFKTGNLGNGTI